MSNLKIESAFNSDVIELEKRTYLPFVLTSSCPRCGAEVRRDLSCNYLSYPIVGRPEKVHFVHEAPDAWHEWHEQVVVGLTLTPAPKEASDGE